MTKVHHVETSISPYSNRTILGSCRRHLFQRRIRWGMTQIHKIHKNEREKKKKPKKPSFFALPPSRLDAVSLQLRTPNDPYEQYLTLPRCMAAYTKLGILLFLALIPSGFTSSLYTSDVFESTPDNKVTCEWKIVNEELDCGGKSFIYEAQDVIGSTRWWLDLGIVTILLIFAGMSPSSPLHITMIYQNPSVFSLFDMPELKRRCHFNFLSNSNVSDLV
jgi:hypothetical protein